MYLRNAISPMILAAVLVMPVSSWAQTPKTIQYQTLSGNFLVSLGSGNSVRFAAPEAGLLPILVTRPVAPLLCAGPAVSGGSVATVDPNGYLPPTGLEMRAHEPGLALSSFPPGAQLRAAAGIRFDDLLYPVQPDVIVIGGLEARCVPGLLEPTPEPPISSCSVQPDSYFSDEIQAFGFEMAGQLQLNSRVIESIPGGIYYEHVIQAVGGPVSGIQLRELFPYNNNQPGSPIYQHALNIDSAWACRASAGARCRSDSITDAARGYVHLDSASLADGACLRIVALRSVNQSEGVNDDFSGSLQSAVFYHGHDDNGGSEHNVLQSRINFDQ